jgi:UDP-GlcNAc:undecaprenyl-phosphate/decaprenyl-phosphate GlcNAc-1-phosphate transferase
MVDAFLGSAFVACTVAYLIVRYAAISSRLSNDIPGSGPQKFHSAPTPRIGGVAILLGVFTGALLLRAHSSTLDLTLVLVLCSLLAFSGGLTEDFTKRVAVRLRLLLTFISAALGYFLLDSRITQLGLPGFDWMLQFTLFSLALTLFAVGGFAQAMNIIDGFNGLAGVIALIFLGAIAYVASAVADEPVMWSALILGAAIIGFLLLNYPKGRVFLGDGGAYLIGFLIAELTLLLVHRNTEVSPWFAFALLSYPIVEVIFSIYRKRVLRGQSPGEPDGLHLHMLIHKRLVRRFSDSGGTGPDVWANALTSPFLWMLALLPAFASVCFWHDTMMLQGIAIAFVALYVTLYWRIVRFRTPRLFRFRRLRGTQLEEFTSPKRVG